MITLGTFFLACVGAAVAGLLAKLFSITAYYQAGFRRMGGAFWAARGSILAIVAFDAFDGVVMFGLVKFSGPKIVEDLSTAIGGLLAYLVLGLIAGGFGDLLARRFPRGSWFGQWYAPLETRESEEQASNQAFTQLWLVRSVRGTRQKAFRTVKRQCYLTSQDYYRARETECDNAITVVQNGGWGRFRNLAGSVRRYGKQVSSLPTPVVDRLSEEPVNEVGSHDWQVWLISLIATLKEFDLIEPLRDGLIDTQ